MLLEKGSLVDYIRRFPTSLVWFSTPELLEIGGVPFVTSTVRPTRDDTLHYYQRVARHFALDIRYHDTVTSLTRVDSSFEVGTASGETHHAKNVVVATGYFDNPNTLSVPGEERPNVFHYYSEPHNFFDCPVAVIGGRNSAVEAALDLYRHGAQVTLIHRGPKLSDGVKYWVLPDIENRIKAGQVEVMFNATVKEITENRVIANGPDGIREIPARYSFVLIGFQPNTRLLQDFGIEMDPLTLAPRFNPDTFETNTPGLFVAGSVVAGKNNNKVFVENGRLHGGTIVKAIQSRFC